MAYPYCERPRLTLVTARVSPMVELARWLLERANIPYHEDAHAPVLHVLATRLAGGGNEVPVALTAGGVWDGARDFIHGLDSQLPPAQKVFSADPQERTRDIAFVDEILRRLLKPVRRHVYHALLPYPKLIKPVACDGAPLWERAIVRGLYGPWRRLMARGLDFSPAMLADAPGEIAEAFDLVAGRLNGQPFLGGAKPSGLDIIFSALAAPVIFPPQYGARLPKLDELPSDFRTFVQKHREHRAGALVLRTYAAARPTPQVFRAARRAKTSWLPPALFRRGLNLARYLRPSITVGNTLVVLDHASVEAVIGNDIGFAIEPVNRARIAAVNQGDFILGLDRQAVLVSERTLLYRALGSADLAALVAAAEADAEQLLTAAAEQSGRIDVVNGYARIVAARTASRLLGIVAPTEIDLMSVARAIFHHTFLNLGDDVDVAARGKAAGQEVAGWLRKTIQERRATGRLGDDVLGRLLALTPDDELARRTVCGLYTGAIDTTATSVANIMAEVLANARVQRQMGEAARSNPGELLGWCLDLLRMRPHNPLVVRQAAAGATLNGKAVPAGRRVFAVTLSAMHDEAAFPHASQLCPTRPLNRYLHFGGGLHRCAGLDLNVRQVPMLVGQLLKRNPVRAGRLRYDGPFPDELVIELQT